MSMAHRSCIIQNHIILSERGLKEEHKYKYKKLVTKDIILNTKIEDTLHLYELLNKSTRTFIYKFTILV